MRSEVLQGDALTILKTLPSGSVHTCVTSPPYYGLRDYQVEGQIGLETTPDTYIARLVAVFAEVRRVLRDDGTLWLNIGDSYAGSWGNYGGQNRGNGSQRKITVGSQPTPAWDGREQERPAASRAIEGIKPKDLIGIPWMLAFALRADGWHLRQEIIWAKGNTMPESVTDRCTKAHESLFLLAKSDRYYFDQQAIKEKSAYPNGPNSPQSIKSHYGQGFFRDAEKEREVTEPRSFKGSKFNAGKTAEHQLFRSSDSPRVTGNLPGRDDGGRACNKPDQEFRNKRSVWFVNSKPYLEAHFAVFPPDLIKPCILAGAPEGGTVLDCFVGSGTTLWTANSLCRHAIGIELNAEYVTLIQKRLAQGFLDWTNAEEEKGTAPMEERQD